MFIMLFLVFLATMVVSLGPGGEGLAGPAAGHGLAPGCFLGQIAATSAWALELEQHLRALPLAQEG